MVGGGAGLPLALIWLQDQTACLLHLLVPLWTSQVTTVTWHHHVPLVASNGGSIHGDCVGTISYVFEQKKWKPQALGLLLQFYVLGPLADVTETSLLLKSYVSK